MCGRQGCYGCVVVKRWGDGCRLHGSTSLLDRLYGRSSIVYGPFCPVSLDCSYWQLSDCLIQHIGVHCLLKLSRMPGSLGVLDVDTARMPRQSIDAGWNHFLRRLVIVIFSHLRGIIKEELDKAVDVHRHRDRVWKSVLDLNCSVRPRGSVWSRWTRLRQHSWTQNSR